MLERLTIRSVALIDRAELEFSCGLNVLTGETGAGKSVILDCIDFLLGAKAERSMIRFGETECSVQAEFSACGAEVDAIIEECGIEAEETLVIARKLTAEGKSSARINGSPVTLSMLRRITSLLVDVHGQSEHFSLLNEGNQLRLLDSVAGASVSQTKEQVKALLEERKALSKSLAALGGDEGERDRRADILQYQIEELRRAALTVGEEETLSARRALFWNAEKIRQELCAAREALLADGGSLDGIGSAVRSLGSLSKFDEKFGVFSERLENAASELQDVASEIERSLDELELDEGAAERVEQRLEEIRAIKKKYGGTEEAALSFLSRAEEEYEFIRDSGRRCEELTARLKETDERLYIACLALSLARKLAAEEFTARVTAELRTLNISAARFEIEFESYGHADTEKATQEGLGGVRFLFSANAGEPLKELGHIISGGEMSRFMLAVKANLSSSEDIGAYVFDEIDAGIGGKTARVVAEKFYAISRSVQLIAVTHLAQIASFADRSFYIEKTEENGRALTTIRMVEGEARLREIARLIGGADGEIAVRHAQSLLDEAAVYKKSLSSK